MKVDMIEAIGIDDSGSLWVKPATCTFRSIYREAMEVHWDPERLCLFAPKPREWSYCDWFRQIKAAASEQGVDLWLTPATRWSNIDVDLQSKMAALGR
jgi:hypothetical protein